MAEGNSESVNLKMGDKSLGISTKDLIPIMMMIMATVAGYFLWQTISLGLRAVYQRQQTILERMDKQDEKLALQTREFARLLAIHDYNKDRPPEERLPLDIDATWIPKPVVPEMPLRRSPSRNPVPRDDKENDR